MKKGAVKIIVEFFRLLVGCVFVFSGLVKAIDPAGTAIKIEEYLSAFGLHSWLWMDHSLAFTQAALEFTLGFCLLMGVYRKLTTFCILIIMCFMTPLTLYLAIFNPVADCGCFGDALVITNWQTFWKNIVLLAGAFFLYKYCRRMTSLYTYKAYWFVVIFSFFFCVAFCFYNSDHLPTVDFRPYKVGANIFQLMEIPEDAPQDEFLFIYEKEGTEREFALADIPVGDSAWRYVDKKLIRQGFMPKVSSFELYDAAKENIADRLLSQPGALFLLIAPDLKKASDKHIEAINDAYDYAREAHRTFYGVTASPPEDIDAWRKNTGADYPFLTADDVLLKTMIRSNPGLILLSEGTIMAKWHHNDIPKENQLAEVVAGYMGETALHDGTPVVPAEKNTTKERLWLRIISGFALPLLLIWFYDFFRNRRTRKKKTGLQTTNK